MKTQLLKLLETRERRCAICGKPLENEIKDLYEYYSTPEGERPRLKRKKINIDVDHIYPRSKGGLDELFNLQITHATCNVKKSNTWTEHI